MDRLRHVIRLENVKDPLARDADMVWAMLALLGLALGCVFRLPALLMVATMVGAGSLLAETVHGTTPGTAILISLLRVALLQLGYLAGLFARAAMHTRG